MEICLCHWWLEVQVGAAIQEPRFLLLCHHQRHHPCLRGQSWVTGTCLFQPKGRGKAELLQDISFTSQVTLKLHRALPFPPHWPKVSHMPTRATREAGKYSRHQGSRVSRWKSYQGREMFCWTTILLCHGLPPTLLIFNKKAWLVALAGSLCHLLNWALVEASLLNAIRPCWDNSGPLGLPHANGQSGAQRGGSGSSGQKKGSPQSSTPVFWR